VASDAERFDELATGVLAPLVLGGKLHLVRPLGRLGLTVGEGRHLADSDLRSRIDIARVRRARLLAPIDTLPELEASDWALVAALNDLLQVTNHELAGAFTKGRYMRLIGSVLDVCARIAPPRDVGAALSRHATVARVMELVRSDTSVRWWTGSANFRGEPPPKRLLLWRDVRRVHVDTQRVPLHEMCEGLPPLVPENFVKALGAWLSLSPLTDLGTSTRVAPDFAWSPASIALIAVPAGRVLAFRALARLRIDAVNIALQRARTSIAPSLAAHLPVVDEFSREVLASLEALSAKPEKRGSSLRAQGAS